MHIVKSLRQPHGDIWCTTHQVRHPRQRKEGQQEGDQEEEQGHLEAIRTRV